MSCSLWRYTESCDYHPCPGDCDLCEENNEDEDNTDNSLGDGDWTRVGVPTVDYGVHND